MSDKSFGDHTIRNIVKNPLLSSAVTGLSLEDLTHKAVLLPVTPSLGQITRSDQQQGLQAETLAHPGHETHVLPSGDALSNVTLSKTPQITNPNVLDSEYNVKLEKNRNTPTTTQSKTTLKSDDDFDVNEYIARLQGSRYVSAPLHSHHKDDQNANLSRLQTTEDNLEEINLNESQGPVEIQQSLTADIAQNFSQLPTVLPHVASAVFSSFSNMLNYKSREQTPDRSNVMAERDQRSKGYDEVQFQRPDVVIPSMGVEVHSAPKAVAPPPKEPPIGGTSNFRLTTKKKYAQVPGLSSGDSTQPMTINSTSHNIPLGYTGMPPTVQNIPISSEKMSLHLPPSALNVPVLEQNISHVNQAQILQNEPPFSHPPYTQNVPPISQYLAQKGGNEPYVFNSSKAELENSAKATEASTKTIKRHESPENAPNGRAGQSLQYNTFNPITAESPSATSDRIASENQAHLLAVNKNSQYLFTTIEQKEQASQNIPSNIPGGAPIIPPPPMFSNLPKRDSQSGVGKSILPPSVARRISANQPIIKPAVSAPLFTENVFVPPPALEAVSEISGHVEKKFSTESCTLFSVPAHAAPMNADVIQAQSSCIRPPPQMDTPFKIPPVITQTSVPTTSFIPSQQIPQNIQTPATFFNPINAESVPSIISHPITQMPLLTNAEPPKSVIEPPKATGHVNFRMTKKRPQYYAGPIEGVGAISNNVKPVIDPIVAPAVPADISHFQSTLFTPEQPLLPAKEQYSSPNIEQSSVPYDISRPAENISSHTPFDISTSQEQTYLPSFDISSPQAQSYGQSYNTAFDMSRATTDMYDLPKQESKGFGIIGSLKSKLSSIDINKIQNTVTTFFDPAYNEAKASEPIALDNPSNPHHQQLFGNSSQEQSNLDIFVPAVEHNQYSEYKHIGYDYSPKYQYYQTQEPYNQNQGENVYSTSSYFTDPNYSTEQVHTTNPLYDSAQNYFPATTWAPINISETINTQTTNILDNKQFYSPNASTQESIKKFDQRQLTYTDQNKNDPVPFTLNKNSQQPYFTPNTLRHSIQELEQGAPICVPSVDVPKKVSENLICSNRNVFVQESDQTSLNKCFDMHTSSQAEIDLHKNKSVLASQIIQEPIFYNPNLFEGKQDPNTQMFESFRSESSQVEQQSTYDSALNTSKYTMGNIKSPPQQNILTTPLVPDSSFFDNPQTGHLPILPKDNKIDFKLTRHVLAEDETRSLDVQEEQFESKNIEINKMLSDTPVPATPDAKTNEQRKDIQVDKEKLSKVKKVIGLSGLISDRPIENDPKHPFETVPRSNDIFNSNTDVGFFENIPQEKLPENVLLLHENIAKGIASDTTGLSITDVKNVLLIEPPQETIGTVLKRNASSNKLEISLNPEQVSSEHYKRQNDSLPSTVFQEQLSLKFDETASDVFFKHSESPEKEVITQKDVSVEENENPSDLNICETCREVQTPVAGYEANNKDIEDLTSQLIENITSRMSLSNPVTVPFTENDASIEDRSRFDDKQLEEITHIAENTIGNLHVRSANDILNVPNTTMEVNDYGWTTENSYSATAHGDHDYGFKLEPGSDIAQEFVFATQIDSNLTKTTADNANEFKLNPNSIGFHGSNTLFIEQLPTNASDETKAEIKHSHEEIVLPRQMSIPSAPPAEDDTKSDETGGLDVNSIEQDAKKDFPLEEEFIIEPSETDDDKIEFKERKRSSEDSTSFDTFTNRVERFKQAGDNEETQAYGSTPMSMASYFDTGNYAVESHFKNSLRSPASINTYQFSSNTMRIPPGFEEEYARRLSGMSISSGENRNEPFIPETSTQTRTTSAITYSRAEDSKENVIGFEMRRKENTEASLKIFVDLKTEANNPIVSESGRITSNLAVGELVQTLPTFTEMRTHENLQSLVDPINFFSANTEETKSLKTSEESVNRLASYFSMPSAQPDHSKSFFELSQSQNHYRHKTVETENGNIKSFFECGQNQNHYIDDTTKHNITDLMKDLTSPRNLHEQIVRTVNYFTVEISNEIKHNSGTPIKSDKILEENHILIDSKIDSNPNINNTILATNDSKDIEHIMDCKYCINSLPGINTSYFKVRTANDTTMTNTETEMTNEKENNGEKRPTVNFGSFDAERQTETNEGITVLNEQRPTSEYTPVKFHWFYRVDVEEKSVWRGFSRTDSRALEDAFHSPDLNESTLVATDGGRFDVNVLGRLRLAVYWKEKPTNVRRCSWFYKGTTDARYVPYTEAVAEKLEEEYQHGVTTGEWHRRLSLPNSEMVIMHGPSVMVHFLHSGATDAFTTPPSLLGKRVYRNPPKINVARDQPQTIDHLIFMVHGAGEHRPYIEQTTSRPRVVRRGHEESEIEDCEPSSIDHLLLLCHGVGSACDMRFRSVEEVVEDFRSTSLQLLLSHYRNSFDNGIVSRVEVLPISWHAQLHSGETGVDRRLSRVTLDSIPRLRAFTNHTVLDVLFYTSPVFHQTIIDTVCSELNRIYNMFKQRNPSFKGNVSLGGHSLGSVILYDLLCHQTPEKPLEHHKKERKPPSEKTYLSGSAGTGQLCAKYPQLVFAPAALYALGSPIAIFECIRGVESLGMDFALPTCRNFFNIFHPYDPIAYRIEPLLNPQLQEIKPSQIPHHKGRKRMHLELKDTMVRVGTDLKQKLIESLRTTWNKWKASPPTDGQLEKVVEEEIEKEQLCDESKDEQAAEVTVGPEALGALNNGRRVDYVLQEAPLEMINEYLFAMTSHVGYWESEDTMLLMLREIYSSLGVQPDCTVPQQSMTVQRTKTLSQDEASLLNEKEIPSTSRGGT